MNENVYKCQDGKLIVVTHTLQFCGTIEQIDDAINELQRVRDSIPRPQERPTRTALDNGIGNA